MPLKYNDGSSVEYEKIQLTKQEVVVKFGAVTMEPQSIFGLWVYKEKEYEDELIRLIVDVSDTKETEEFFRSYKEILKERFGQIDICITAFPIRII
ncbi:hypothetical protein KKH65_00320 [bacterium]|nr:hypothetical protein [bacterium]